jgi:putative RecB family exonuclease
MKKKNSAAAAPAGANLFGEAPPSAPAKADGLLAFSYSKMSLYEECPLKYKFKYLDKIKEEPKFYFAFGSAIHSALEFMYAVKAPPFPTIEEVHAAFCRDWNSKSYLEKGYRTQDRSDADYEKGLKMLTAYYEHNRARLAPPFLLEYSTDVAVDGLKVRIIADKIEYCGGGRVLVTDYKTGKDVRREPAQLYMYQKITELDPVLKEKIAEAYGQRVSEVRIDKLLYYHVPTNKEYFFDRADDREIGGFWERVLGVADSIRGLKFEPTPGERQCSWCDYKALCPAFFGGRQQAPQAPLPGPGNIEVLVDRYGRLKEKMQEIQAELDKVAEDIGRAAKSGSEYAGNSFTATVSKSQKWAFPDREGVLGVLNQFDLYQKALDVTLAGLGRLLDSPDLAPEARQKLLEQAVRKTAVDIKLTKKGD